MKELFLIPYAGGTSLSYSKWNFDGNIRAVALDYKGHGLRRREKLDEDYDDIVRDITQRIMEKSFCEEINIFGHSMGGLIGWDVTQNLKMLGKRVCNFFVSSCVPPHVFNGKIYEILSTERGVMNWIRKENRLTEHQLESRYFKELVYPTIINDYRILSACPKHEIIISDYNIICLFGKNDSVMNPLLMSQWEKYSSEIFALKAFEGDHYYFENKRNCIELIKLIESKIINP